MPPDDRCRSKTWAGRAPLRRVLGVRPARAGCRAVRDSTLVAWYRSLTHLAREGRMTVTIGRRELLTVLGGVAIAWPLAARAQQSAMPGIGFLGGESPGRFPGHGRAVLEGLGHAGYVQGKNVAIEYRWAEGRYELLPAMAAELVSRKVAVIAAPGNTPAALAAKAATTTTPIVFGIGGDPVQAGLVANPNRPGGNVTGFPSMNAELAAKQVGLLHELLPAAARFAVLVNPGNLIHETMIRDAEKGAAALGLQIEVLSASTNRDITTAFTTLL